MYDTVKILLGILQALNAILMKWNLTVYNDPKAAAPASFNLLIYTVWQAGNKGFMEGSITKS